MLLPAGNRGGTAAIGIGWSLVVGVALGLFLLGGFVLLVDLLGFLLRALKPPFVAAVFVQPILRFDKLIPVVHLLIQVFHNSHEPVVPDFPLDIAFAICGV